MRIRRPSAERTLCHLLASQDRGLLKGLADRNRIRLFSFGDEPVLVGTARARAKRSSRRDQADPEAEWIRTSHRRRRLPICSALTSSL